MAKLNWAMFLTLSLLGIATQVNAQSIPADDLTAGMDPSTRAAYERIKSKMLNSKDKAIAERVTGDKELREFVSDNLGSSVDEVQRKTSPLVVLVSLSMPVNMLDAYGREAKALSAPLVVRGIPDGWTMNDYLRNVMFPYAEKGVAISIDPTLFDRYGVDAVPTIVWEPLENYEPPKGCKPVERQHRVDSEQADVAVTHCSEAPTDKYWSLSGGVTLDWALQQFADAKAPGADEALEVLRGSVPPSGRLLDIERPSDPSNSLLLVQPPAIQNTGERQPVMSERIER